MYFGNDLKASGKGNSLTFSNLSCATEYQSITVKAKDAAGNVSDASDTKSIATGACVSFALTVNGGSGSGSYNSGQIVSISADPAPSGKIFDKWIGSNA